MLLKRKRHEHDLNIDSYKLTDGLQFPSELDNEFALAIFELGLKLSSPKTIMKLLPPFEDLTLENIKSHLQKFRVNKERSKDEFIKFYDEYMHEAFKEFQLSRKRSSSEYVMQKSQNEGCLKTESEHIIEQSNMIMTTWMNLYQKVLEEHSKVRNILQTASVVNEEDYQQSMTSSNIIELDNIDNNDTNLFQIQNISQQHQHQQHLYHCSTPPDIHSQEHYSRESGHHNNCSSKESGAAVHTYDRNTHSSTTASSSLSQWRMKADDSTMSYEQQRQQRQQQRSLNYEHLSSPSSPSSQTCGDFTFILLLSLLFSQRLNHKLMLPGAYISIFCSCPICPHRLFGKHLCSASLLPSCLFSVMWQQIGATIFLHLSFPLSVDFGMSLPPAAFLI
eukprot:gene4024-8014_t